MSEAYLYQTLPENYIRIIQFDSDVPSAPLDFSLIQTTLPSPIDYFALSYAWGRENLYETVICNGAPLRISSGLHKIILKMYELGLAKRFWIDAICINQEDDHEKASQIPMMGKIYRSCMAVIVWLGESDDETLLAIDTMKELALVENSSVTERFEKTNLDEGHEARRTELTIAQSKAVMNLFGRPWFTRTWVVQEVCMWEEHQAPLVFCGHHHMSWHGVLLAWQRLSKFQMVAPRGLDKSGKREPQAAPTACFISDALMLRRAAKKTTSLLELLVWARPLHAKDPRDKVFAVLGLMTSPEIQIVTPQPLSPTKHCKDEIYIPRYQRYSKVLIDYQEKVSCLYEEVARVIISVAKSLEILCFVGCSTSSHSELPSWVPDWASQPPTTALHVPHRQPASHAANFTTAYVDSSPTPGFLGIAAFFFDSIAESADICATEEDTEGIAPLVMSLWMCFGSKLSTYPDGGSPVNAFWRTVIANVRSDAPEYSVPSDSFGRAFLTLALIMQHDGSMEKLGCVRSSCLQTSFCQCCGETKEMRRCGTRMVKASRVRTLGIDHFSSNVQNGTTSAAVYGKHMLSTENSVRGLGRCMIQEMGQFVQEIDPLASIHPPQFLRAAKAAMFQRRFFITARGHFGLGPADARPGDQVAILKGGPLPFLLRPSEATAHESELPEKGIFRLLGES